MKQMLMLTMFAAIAVGCGNVRNGNAEQERVETVGVVEFAAIVAQREDSLVSVQRGMRLLDVRTPEEYAGGHIAGAENIDLKAADFAERIKDIHDTVAVYCHSGRRSLVAASQLAAQGCVIYNLDGGILAWQQAGCPVAR